MELVNENDKEYRMGDHGPKYLHRGPRMEWGLILLRPKDTLGAHYHKEVEEVFYFLEGEPKMIVNEKEYRVKVGDAFRIEPEERHDIINDTNECVKIVFIKTPFIPEDKVNI